MGEFDSGGTLGPGRRDAWLAFAETRGLASYAQRVIRCRYRRNALLALSTNDADRWVLRSEFLLGSCAAASCVKSTHEGGNAAHVFHLTSLLLLLSCRTGKCGPECTALVRPERHRLWFGFGL